MKTFLTFILCLFSVCAFGQYSNVYVGGFVGNAASLTNLASVQVAEAGGDTNTLNTAVVQKISDSTNSFKITSLLDATNSLNTAIQTQRSDSTNSLNTALVTKISDATNSFKTTSLLDATNTLESALSTKRTDSTNSLNTALVTKITDSTNSFKSTSLLDATNTLNTALQTQRADSTNSFKSTSLLDATNTLNTALTTKCTDATNSFKTTSLLDATNTLNTAVVQKITDSTNQLNAVFFSGAGLTKPVLNGWTVKEADYTMWGTEPPNIGVRGAKKISLPGNSTNVGKTYTIISMGGGTGTNAINLPAGSILATNTGTGRATQCYNDGTNWWVIGKW